MNLAERLVSLRRQNGLTQLQLAEKMDVSRQAVSRWEKGEAVPSTENLKYLSELYHVTLDYLLSDSASETEAEGSARTEEIKRCRAGRRKTAAAIFLGVIVLLSIVFLFVKHTGGPVKNEESPRPISDLEQQEVLPQEEEEEFSIEGW